MLCQLPQLRGVKLGIHAYWGTEVGCIFPKTHEVDWVSLPALAGVTALTELELVAHTSLPPDWRQLSSLQRLRMMGSREVPVDNMGGLAGWQPFQWGTAPLTALTALTRLEVHQDLLPGTGSGGARLGRLEPIH